MLLQGIRNGCMDIAALGNSAAGKVEELEDVASQADGDNSLYG